jgi:hypothetical protein
METDGAPKHIKNMLYELYTQHGKKILPTRFYVRPVTRRIKQLRKTSLVGVEIGVDHGFNAKTILKHLPIEQLYLIDIQLRQKTKQRLATYQNKIEFIEKPSEEAAQEIPNNLDFVYIDGSHQYDYVKKDIELYYPKVKKGGIFGGHDFDASHMDICKAVLEFAQQKHLTLHGERKDWWVIKDK